MSNFEDDNGSASSIRSLGAAVIPVVNKLQDILSTAGESLAEIELPQVAVVGSQSSGKSSVLEALVGRDFLPRGNDICTRRPLLLRLVRHAVEEEYGEFHHLTGKKFFDFSEIRREIKAETARGAGENKGVSNKQICLTIYSPNVLDITLVDLPGMTKVPVGDQPSDIESRIRTMILSYIRKSSCLILAVTPANSDLANSDALQIAGIADPDGNRTIGVITKLDIMDRGTDACSYLLGNVIPLRLGYVGVVNRSQEDIKFNRSIKDALASEESFFRDHPVYNSISDRCGIPQLAKKLNQILVRHIYKVLPGLKSRIRSKMNSVYKELSSYGHMEKESDRGALILNILSKYSKGFASIVEGRDEDKLTSEVHGGARILYIFQSIFVDRLEKVNPFEGLTDDDIRTAIHNATGPRSALFVPEVPFQVLIRRQIARLLDPSLQCAGLVYNELVKISHSIIVSDLHRFPLLRKCMDKVVGELLLKGLAPSQDMIGHIINMEIDYINTSHPNFIGGSNAIEDALRHVRSYSMATPMPRPKEGVDSDAVQASEKIPVSRAVGLRFQPTGITNDEGVRSVPGMGLNGVSGRTNGSSWVSSIFRGRETNTPVREMSRSNDESEHVYHDEHASSSMIYLREPPTMLRSSEIHSEQEAVGLAITKRLLESYYAIVRKNIEDSVPKAIMHFLVNRTKREMHNILIKNLYRDNLLEELLQETEGVAEKRSHAQEALRALKQAEQTLEQLPIEAEGIENGY